MICIPITEKTNAKAIISIKKAEQYANIIEIRVDYIKNPNLKLLLKKINKPAIITNRKRSEGGNFQGSEIKRIHLLQQAIDLGVEYIDIELSSGIKTIKKLCEHKKRSKIIVSYHNFNNIRKWIQIQFIFTQ